MVIRGVNMQKASIAAFFFVIGLLALLQGCIFQNQSSSTPTYTYQWMSEFSDNFSNGKTSWTPMVATYAFSDTVGSWSWRDTSGGKLALQNNGATAKGHVHGMAFIKGGATNPVQLSLYFQLSSTDSNSATVMLVDSGMKRQYVLSIGRDSGKQPAPGVLALFCESTDSAHKVISETHQTLTGLVANAQCQLVLKLDSSSMQGELLQTRSSIASVVIDSGAFRTSVNSYWVFAAVDLDGTASSPVQASMVSVTSFYTSYTSGYNWQWSDTSLIRFDSSASLFPVKAIGHASGIPLWNSSSQRCFWTTDSPQRVSMSVNLSSTATGAAAITVLDSASNRQYWLIIGNDGVGQSTAGVLSVIITRADNFQTIIGQAQHTVQNLGAATDYRLILTLGLTKVIGEIQQAATTIAQAEIQSSAVTAGSPVTFCPGVDLYGTVSAPVYAANFQVESFQQVSTSGGGSCPFIYSFDNGRYTIDAEPYGGSICKGLKRTEACVLDHLRRQTHGAYRLLMTNELDETQYTDALKLIVVDHPCSLSVAPDVSGRIHTFSRPLAPLSANDRVGKDIRPLVSSKDARPWTGSMKQFDPDAPAGPRDTLTFRFAKPENAASAKLLVNAGTTAWGAAMGRRFLSMYGSGLGLWYDEVDKGGIAHERIMNWYHDEELYILKLQVATRQGWETRAAILGAGPVIAPDRVYVIDVHDVPGDTLTVRVAPPAGFWKIDWIAVDYTRDAAVTVQEVSPRHALNSAGVDVRQELDRIDNNCHVAEKGDSVWLDFPAPPQAKNIERTVVLEANGYYRMHLKESGLPELSLLADMNKPGFSARFALREYRKQERARAR